MTTDEIIKELNRIENIGKITNPWFGAYYLNLKEEYMTRIFQKNMFKDKYNHENEKELLKNIDIKKVFKDMGQ